MTDARAPAPNVAADSAVTSRQRLPNRRGMRMFDIERAGHRFTASCGVYAVGRCGEVFLNAHRTASEIEALGRDAGILISIALQHGVATSTMAHAITRDEDGAPATLVGVLLDAMSAQFAEKLA